ncbi:MAG: molybdate transporter permease subunit [Actinomycetota bacterium]|jgi:molybdate transport system permease protein
MTTRRRSRTLTLLAALAVAFVVLPLLGVALRLPWSDAWSLATSATARRAAWVSLQTSVVAAVLAAVLGIPLGWWLARTRARGVGLVRSFVVMPMILPPVVAGIALLSVFGRSGVIGQPLLEWWGISIPFTRTAVVIAQVFVSIPFLVLAVESSFRQQDAGLEDAARTLGASPMRVFVTVALPGARPAIVAGVALAWARSIGEFGASITFAGSFPGRTQTLPMSVYELVSTDYPAALSVSFAMMLLSVLVIASLRGRWMVAR